MHNRTARSSKQKLKLRSAWRKLWQRAAAVIIGCQFLVPAGYMPGALADGTPFVLCHMYTGAPGPQAHAGNGHAEHDTHAGGDTHAGDGAHADDGTLAGGDMHAGDGAHGDDGTHAGGDTHAGGVAPAESGAASHALGAASHAAGALHSQTGSAAAGSHEDHTNAETWENCPLGALGAAAALPASATDILAVPLQERIPTRLTARRGILTPLNLRARAPPVTHRSTLA